jgi:hypothetical protein
VSDPLVLLAKQRIIKASADLEVQLGEKTGGGPAIEILRRLRDRAAESLAGLAVVNLFTADGRCEAVVLQNEVKRYDEWIGWIRGIIAEGVAADREMHEEEREELLDVLLQSSRGEQEAIELGMIDPGPSD